MRYTVDVGLQAKTDVYNIASYISKTLKNPDAALRHMDAFENATTSLAMMQERIRPSLRVGGNEIRFLPVMNYFLAFTIDGSSVKVIRVLYSRIDLSDPGLWEGLP